MTRIELSLEKKKNKKARIRNWAMGLGTLVGIPFLTGFSDGFGSGFGSKIGEAFFKILQHLILS
ncbi:hypothetical protein [Priestia aryabhattai]|uniref:hypothetical protein n=1 Tax=Priestia aryabhattai TaxID=412384 RepID=UPI001CCB54B2|nr:hypothetical protein [Priestia aryabhattai]MBZ6485097.1 hypothetical protein [Priestia aryabhattai]